jgi:excisionase family DNA binding protein
LSRRIRSEEFFTVPEFAAHFGVSQALIYREVAAQRVPAVRIGAAIRIPREFADNKTAAATLAASPTNIATAEVMAIE